MCPIDPHLLAKYPRTPHLEGSRFQTGDHDLEAVSFREIQGCFVVAEEKLDGSNCGISFDEGGGLLLQSRGHFLTGGPRERHFGPLKQWATVHQAVLRSVLGTRYVLYGEWLYAKHTCFYDRLPHYFMEFDILDRASGKFLSSSARRALLAGTPLVSVPVLWQGVVRSLDSLTSLVGPSLYKSPDWRGSLEKSARSAGADVERTFRETDDSSEMEGLYLKVEDGDRVVRRLKFIRASFLNRLLDSGSHWQDRPLVPNGLAPGVDLWTS